MDYEEAMKLALAEAALALEEGEVPVGAVVMKNGELISSAHNNRENAHSIAGHAEILAMQKAEEAIGRWQLDDCQLIVTLEPCIMCAAAIGQARISTLVYGASDKQYGAFSTNCDPFTRNIYPSPLIYKGVKEEKCQELLNKFFKSLR